MNPEKPAIEPLINKLKNYTNEIDKALTPVLNKQIKKLVADIVEEKDITPTNIKTKAMVGVEFDKKHKESLITAYDWAHFLFSIIDQKKLLKNYYDFFHKVTRPQFIKALESDNNIFYYVSSVNNNQQIDTNYEVEEDDFDENLVASCRMEIKSDNELHFASLFTSTAHYARLGLLTAKTIIDQASNNGFNVTANVDCNSPIVGYYLNNIDFIADGILVDVEGTGVNGWHLNRISGNKIDKRESKNQIEMTKIDWLNLPDDFELIYQTDNNDNSFTEVCKTIFDQNYYLTNYELTINNQRPEDEFQVMNSDLPIQRRFVFVKNTNASIK